MIISRNATSQHVAFITNFEQLQFLIMENLIYIVIVIAYFVFQAVQASNKQKAREQAKNKPQAQPARKVREVKPPTPAERMRDMYREVEMKNKPYARVDKTKVRPVEKKPSYQTLDIPSPKIEKKTPDPFLNVDMTKEEVLPEGEWKPVGAADLQKPATDFYKAAREKVKLKVNLRDAVIGKIILERPEW